MRRASLTLGIATVVALTTSGCMPMHEYSATRSAGSSVEIDSFKSARGNPLSAAAHYSTGMSFLLRKSATRGDLEMALSAFQTAARLAPDLWEPLAGAALAVFELGNAREAMNLMAQAIERRGSVGPLAVPFALLAYRAGEPELARSALAQADRTTNRESDRAGLDFLDSAFAGTGWRPVPARQQAEGVQPAGTQTENGQSVVIEAYLIREVRNSDGNRGLNLLDGLSVQFGGTLLNYNYDLSTSGANTQTGGLSITAPAMTYSLNLASSSRSRVTLEASPLVLAREGRKSKFLEGGSVLIVPFSDDSDPIERDVGVSLEVTPQRVGATDVDLDVVLEMSNITGQSVADAGRGAGLLQTDKTSVEVSARVPYGKAIVVGSVDSLARRSNDNRSVSRMQLPGFSRRGQSESRRDVLVVLTVRAPDGTQSSARSADDWSQSLFGVPMAPFSSYGRRPSDTPLPRLESYIPKNIN